MVARDFNEDLVGSVGSFPEKWRFLGTETVGSRARAGVAAGGRPHEGQRAGLECARYFRGVVALEEGRSVARAEAAGRLPRHFQGPGWAVVG